MSDELMELPEGWAKATFGDICKVQGGYAFKSQDYQESGVLLVRISNLVDGRVQISSNSVFLPKEYWGKFSEFQLKEGDVLIAMSGATTGKMATHKLACNFSITAGKDRSQGLSKEAKSGLTER